MVQKKLRYNNKFSYFMDTYAKYFLFNYAKQVIHKLINFSFDLFAPEITKSL